MNEPGKEGAYYRLLEEMTRAESNAAAADGALLVWPLGATEQHGPHLPVSTDTLAIEHLVRNAAAQAAQAIPIVVAPTLPFGSSEHHVSFGGTMSIGTENYYRIVSDLVRSLIQGGYQRLFLLNGHGGNHELLQLVARDLALQNPVNIAAASYWAIAWDDLIALDAHVDCRLPGHAGKFETSIVLALRQDLVQEPLPHREISGSTDPRGFASPYRAERAGAWQAVDGYSDSPHRADGKPGRAWLSATVSALSKAMIEFHRSPLHVRPPSR